MTSPAEGLLTISEVAERLQVSRPKAYAMAQANEIPVVRIGRSVRVPADALDAWIKERTEPPAA